MATGEVVDCIQDLEWDDGSFFWWTEGNMSCDCNRKVLFHRAKGEECEFNQPCGDGRYVIEKFVLPGGRVLNGDGEVVCSGIGRTPDA